MADTRGTVPFGGGLQDGSGSTLAAVCDATDDGYGAVFYSDTSGAITHVFALYEARAGTPPSYIIALEGVDTSGNPDGTVKGGGSPASVVFTPPADTSWNSTGQWFALDNSYTPARGELLAITVRYSTGSVDASNRSTFTRTLSSLQPLPQTPYNVLLTAGVWAKSNSSPLFGYKTSTGVFGYPLAGKHSSTTATNGHRQCLKFAVPSDWGSAIGVSKICVNVLRHGSTGGLYRVGIWDASGSELISSGDLYSSVAANVTNRGSLIIPLPSVYSITPGSTYYIGIQNSSTQTMGVSGNLYADAGDRAHVPYGTSKCLSVWNGSAWTDNTLVVPNVDLVLDTITFPSGNAITGLKRGIRI